MILYHESEHASLLYSVRTPYCASFCQPHHLRLIDTTLSTTSIQSTKKKPGDDDGFTDTNTYSPSPPKPHAAPRRTITRSVAKQKSRKTNRAERAPPPAAAMSRPEDSLYALPTLLAPAFQ